MPLKQQLERFDYTIIPLICTKVWQKKRSVAIQVSSALDRSATNPKREGLGSVATTVGPLRLDNNPFDLYAIETTIGALRLYNNPFDLYKSLAKKKIRRHSSLFRVRPLRHQPKTRRAGKRGKNNWSASIIQ